MKPVFNLALRDGTFKPVQYSPLIYTRGTDVYKLALHKSGRHWIVSHIESGAKICTVHAYYKGMPVASGTETLKNARMLALADIDLLIDRVGLAKFVEVMENPKPF